MKLLIFISFCLLACFADNICSPAKPLRTKNKEPDWWDTIKGGDTIYFPNKGTFSIKDIWYSDSTQGNVNGFKVKVIRRNNHDKK